MDNADHSDYVTISIGFSDQTGKADDSVVLAYYMKPGDTAVASYHNSIELRFKAGGSSSKSCKDKAVVEGFTDGVIRIDATSENVVVAERSQDQGKSTGDFSTCYQFSAWKNFAPTFKYFLSSFYFRNSAHENAFSIEHRSVAKGLLWKNLYIE